MIVSFNGEVSEQDIFDEGISEYDIYSYYLGFQPELATAYKSILRGGDETPSFSIYHSEYHPSFDYMWKDSGAGKLSGHVFDFVNLLFDFKSLFKTRLKIALDFECVERSFAKKHNIPLGNKVAERGLETPPMNERCKIYYLKTWWSKQHHDFYTTDLGIPKTILDLYGTQAFKMYWVDDIKRAPVEIDKREIGVVYPIRDRVKLYRPLVAKILGKEYKRFKFRTDYLPNYVEGWDQIDWSRNDIIVITKSTKDAMWFRSHFGINAVSPRSENTPIPIHLIERLKRHFKKVIYFFDNDQAGLDSAEKEGLRTGLDSVHLPMSCEEKDPTDLYLADKNKALTLVPNLLLKKVYHIPLIL